MRLIDADTLRAEFTGNFHELWHYTGVWAMIDCAPSVDAVPVVRCKDCKHAKMHIDIIGDKHLFCGLATNIVEMEFDDFCSYGERKEETP